MNTIILNGIFLNADEPVLQINNRAFCYGDGLFETMRWQEGKILFFENHFERLIKGMELFKMEIPRNFSPAYFQKHIQSLVEKNKTGGAARIRLQVYRNGGGYYAPENNSVSYIISAEKLNDTGYSLNEKGWNVDIFPAIKKVKNEISNFKTSNSSVYTLAGIYAKENNLDDCLILNTDENIADAISSNVFILKNNMLLTPPLPDGCVDGVMRKNILRIAAQEKIRYEEKSIHVNDLSNADEIFLSNVIQGIRWVGKFRDKTYSNVLSGALLKKICSRNSWG